MIILLELLIDLTNIQAIYAIYVSILLSISVKILWSWLVAESFKNSSLYTTSIDIHLNDFSIQAKSLPSTSNFILWMVRCVRKKLSRGEDGEHLVVVND